MFAGCPCARDPDVGLGRYIVGAESRVPGAGAAAVVCRGGGGEGRPTEEEVVVGVNGTIGTCTI